MATAEGRCAVCNEAVGGRTGGAWVCFQSLWVMPSGDRCPTSVERATGETFVSVHAHCIRMFIQGYLAGTKVSKKRESGRRGQHVDDEGDGEGGGDGGQSRKKGLRRKRRRGEEDQPE